MSWKDQLRDFVCEKPFVLEEGKLNYYVKSTNIKVYSKGKVSIAFIDTPLVSLSFPTYTDISTKEEVVGLNYDDFINKHKDGIIACVDKVPISRNIFYKLQNYV